MKDEARDLRLDDALSVAIAEPLFFPARDTPYSN
jgi:hypothetical protein